MSKERSSYPITESSLPAEGERTPNYTLRRVGALGASILFAVGVYKGVEAMSSSPQESRIPNFATCEGNIEVSVGDFDEYGGLVESHTEFIRQDDSPVSPGDVTRILKGLEAHNDPDDKSIDIPVGNITPAGESLVVRKGETTKVPEVCVVIER